MADNQHSERLEDQLRRMIVSNGQNHTSYGSSHAQQRPIVNLPTADASRQHQPRHSHYGYNRGPPSYGQEQYINTNTFQQLDPRPSHHDTRSHQGPAYPSGTQQNWRQNDYDRAAFSPRAPRQLYDPGHAEQSRRQHHQLRAQHLDQVLQHELPLVDMPEDEQLQKHAFRTKLQSICQEICIAADLPRIELKCFGSLESGFATANSDMDLVIVVADTAQSAARFSLTDNDLPRLLEKKLLQLGHGARLLTRTRVPIIKVCEQPTLPLLSRLRVEREKWDMRDTSHDDGTAQPDEEDVDTTMPLAPEDTVVEDETVAQSDVQPTPDAHPTNPSSAAQAASSSAGEAPETSIVNGKPGITAPGRSRKGWLRERDAGPLDFPKEGVGIQCDINFFNPLGLHNTQLLRCYSRCDPRVRHMVLFVKAWAKRRKINSAYAGTLSSYGYVLMVLHYLMNVATPPVLPNLQHPWRPNSSYTPHGADFAEVDEWLVDFWRNEHEILHAAQSGLLTRNTESVGSLLAGFFSYYAAIRERPFFHWTQNVLSLRTHGGIMSKEEKGWVKARTEEGDGKKVQYRYLFCIEDPFELSHNVARTVTHNGIVAVRDEFRRAARILSAVGQQVAPSDGQLFDQVADEEIVSHPKPRPASVKAPSKEQPQQRVDVSDKNTFPELKATPALQQKMPQRIPQPKQNRSPRTKTKDEPKQAVPTANAQSDDTPDAPAKKPGRSRRRPVRRVPLQMDGA